MNSKAFDAVAEQFERLERLQRDRARNHNTYKQHIKELDAEITGLMAKIAMGIAMTKESTP